MKSILLVLIVLFIFFICAAIGYQVAFQSDVIPGVPAQEVSSDAGGEQHKLIVIQVDQLDSRQPHLVSVWFISLYFANGSAPTITLAQIYPMKTNTPKAQAIEKSFSIDSRGDPAPAFLHALSALKIDWEGFLLLDNQTVQRVMEWVHGPGDYLPYINGIDQNPDEGINLIQQTCKRMVGIDNRQGAALNWTDLVPTHFRSNLRMEVALAYWKRVTTAQTPFRCEIFPAQ